MKTTSKTAAVKRLSKLNISKTSIAYKVAAEILGVSEHKTGMFNDGKVRPVYTSGAGRFCSNQDHTQSIKTLLSQLGIDSILSNDSKRGGLTGNLLTITTKIK